MKFVLSCQLTKNHIDRYIEAALHKGYISVSTHKGQAIVQSGRYYLNDMMTDSSDQSRIYKDFRGLISKYKTFSFCSEKHKSPMKYHVYDSTMKLWHVYNIGY